MTQREYLDVFRGIGAGEQRQPGKGLADELRDPSAWGVCQTSPQVPT
jgi:hypothetical protein